MELLALNAADIPIRKPTGVEIGLALADLDSDDQTGALNALAAKMNTWNPSACSTQLHWIAERLSQDAIRLLEDLVGFARADAQ